MEELRTVIANNLMNLRKASKLTQLELAEKLNYSDKAISKWERGESLPDLMLLKQIADMGYSNLPICMAKTQYSFSDHQTKLGRPTDFEINIREVYISAGAGFVVAITGAIMTMPGLPKAPAAYGIDVDKEGNITGLF